MNSHDLSPKFRELLAEQQRLQREMLDAVRIGLRHADHERFVTAIELAEAHVEQGWRKIILVVRRHPSPPAAFKRWFRDALWVPHGDAVRTEVNDDLLLADALRVLLPSYRGAPIRLWRGESLGNRRRRTYGLSWSRDAVVAESFATGARRLYTGGSVLLETVAPPEAVICSVPSRTSREQEVLIDRRRLQTVRVLARYRRTPA